MSRRRCATGLLAGVFVLLGLLAGAMARAAPTVVATFTPSTVGTGDTSTLTITISNSGALISSVGFSDTYPTNLVNASPSNVTNTCGGSFTGGLAGGGTIGLSGGSIAASSSCSISVNVTSATKGSYLNSTGLVSSSGGSGPAASATLTVVAKPAVVKSFSPTTIAAGGTSTLSLVITNSNATTALSGLAFTDSLPSGLVLAATPSGTCGGGSVAGVSGGTSVALTGGSLTGGSSCTISVSVTAAASGNYTNTTGGISATQYSGTGVVSNSAVLTVLAPPTTTESFSTNPVATATSTTLTVTITNPNSTALTGVAFSDAYGSGFGNVLLDGLANSCGGTATGNGLANSLSLSGGSIAANSSCTVSVIVAGTTTGTYPNTTGAVTTSNAGTGAAASATLIIVFSSSITKSFTPTRVAAGASSVLTFTINNAFITNANGFAFTDNLPTGLVVAAAPALSNGCGGTVTGATANSTSIALSGGAVNALSSCTITVAVQSPTVGNYANTTGALSSSLGTAGTSNTATLQVVSPPTIVKSFSPATLLLGNAATLSLVITNPNALALSGVALSDTFPANMLVSTTPTINNSCGGTLSGTAAGSGSLSLSGGALAAGPGTTCTITIQVTPANLGTYNNTSSGVSANETATGAASNTAVLTVVAPDLRISKSHTGAFVVGTNGVYTLTVDNLGGGIATSGTITVTDTLPAGLGYVATGSGGTGWTCSNSGQVVTCTSASAIAAGGTAAAITLNVTVGATAVPSVTNNVVVAGGSEPAVNAGNNSAADYTLVNATPQSTLSTDGQQTSTPGSSVFYSHVFTAGYAGTVVFSSSDASSPSIAGWTSSIFQDANCNGILDGTEGNTLLTGSVSVAAGGLVCVIDKVFIPATAPYNAQDQTTLTASFTPSSTGTSAVLTRNDLTLVGSAGGAGLTLNKTVRNVTTAETARANDSAASGQTLEYTIAYANNGANSLNNIVINDTTPYFTSFVSAQCVTPLPANLTSCAVTTQPAVSAQGSLVWSLTGSLLGSATGSVSFRVTVQ